MAVALAAAGTATALAGGPVAHESGKLPRLIANCAKPKVKPANVILACGDASFGATGMTWSKWTQKKAHGTGTGQINDCTPDCAHGHPKSAPIDLRLSKVRRCKNGKRLFTKVTYTWTREVPKGAAETGSVPLGCKLLNL